MQISMQSTMEEADRTIFNEPYSPWIHTRSRTVQDIGLPARVESGTSLHETGVITTGLEVIIRSVSK
jgi:hypothetical protein